MTALSRPWVLLVAVLLALGAFLRVYAFDFPTSFLFDEHHFVENARNYLAHRADWNDHPPLGKLFIAASIRVFGDGPVGWRAPALCFGLITVLVGGVTTSRLFRSRQAGLLASALLAADGFLISYSRAGLLDGVLTAGLVLSLLVASCRWNLRLSVLAGVLLGASMNVKFSGVGVAVPLLLSLLLSEPGWKRRVLLWSVTSLVAASVYVGVYAYGLHLAGQPTGVLEVLRDTQRLLDHHAGLTDMKNPYVSGWATWFLPKRALVMGWSEAFGEVRVLSMLGNLAIWWAAVACGAALLATVLNLGLKTVLREAPGEYAPFSLSHFVVEHGRAVVLVWSAALAFLAPWVLTHRDSYLYHFLPTYAALVLLLAALVAWARPRWPFATIAFVGLVLVVAAIYAPLWCSMPMSPEQVRSRLFLEGWR